MYWRMKELGFKSLVAKSPDWSQAGWEGAMMGVILTWEQGPLGVFAGMEGMSLGRVLRAVRCEGVRVLEDVCVVR